MSNDRKLGSSGDANSQTDQAVHADTGRPPTYDSVQPVNSGNGNKQGDRSDLDPFEIEFLPEFRENRGPEAPFVNPYGVTIGDHDYESEHSPLNQWSTETDPSIMAGETWVHPYKDVGFQTEENRDYFEKGIAPQGAPFMHPSQDAAFKTRRKPGDTPSAERRVSDDDES